MGNNLNNKHSYSVQDKIWASIFNRLGENMTANDISLKFNISLSYVYDLIKHHKLKYTYIRNRKVYALADFIKLFEFNDNLQIYDSYSSIEEALNFSINFDPKNPIEKYYVNLLLDELGEFSNIKMVSKMLNISETLIRDEIDYGNILSICIGNRKIILTRSLLAYFRKIFCEY